MVITSDAETKSAASSLALSYFGFVVGFLQVSTKLVPHRGQQLVGEVSLAPRTEALVKRRGENWRWHGFVDRSFNRPASFARVRNMTGKLRKIRVLKEGSGCQVEQPRGDHTSTTPNLRNVPQIHVVLIVLGVTQWRSFRVGCAVCSFADISATQNR